jgi:hypothetical protein
MLQHNSKGKEAYKEKVKNDLLNFKRTGLKWSFAYM